MVRFVRFFRLVGRMKKRLCERLILKKAKKSLSGLFFSLGGFGVIKAKTFARTRIRRIFIKKSVFCYFSWFLLLKNALGCAIMKRKK